MGTRAREARPRFVGAVYVIGCAAPTPDVDLPVRRAAPGEFVEVLRKHASTPLALVFGDLAFAELPAEHVTRALRGADVPLLCPERPDIEAFAEWIRAGVGEVVAMPRLAARLLVLNIARRVRPAMEDVFPDGGPRDAEASRILDALREADAPRVKAWARQLGITPRGLSKRSLRIFGHPAKEVCWRLARCTVESLSRAPRPPLLAIAHAGGFADVSAMTRAFVDRGLVPPWRQEGGRKRHR